MRRTRWTIRTRMTLLYGGVSLLTGFALLGFTYLLVRRTLDDPGLSGSSSSDRARLADELESLHPLAQPVVLLKVKAAADLRQEIRDAALSTLLTQGGIALVFVTMAGVWLGWLVAGRTLRRIQAITGTARRVADSTLHERIALRGPRDELRELADTFDDMLARLDAAFDGQRRFVANASHELRTPLAINRTLIEVALDRPDAPPQLRELGHTLLEVNQRHERVIDGMLTLARAEHAIPDPARVDLADVVSRVVEHAGSEAAGLEVRVQPGTAPVIGDAVLLERLVHNLIENSVRYNIPGGSVRVATEAAAGSARLTVSNTGPVVTVAQVPDLFEPFRRLADRVDSARGSGLGLSIVRSVARKHGGTVVARPRHGGGLIVDVTLPAAPRDPMAS